METYQKRIRDLREDADKTQAEIAEILGTSQTMFARVEAHRDEATLVEVTKSWNRSAGTQSRSGMTPKPALFS